MLKYPLFIAFFAVVIVGYFTLDIPMEISFAETLLRVRKGMGLVFFGGAGSLFCLYQSSR